VEAVPNVESGLWSGPAQRVSEERLAGDVVAVSAKATLASQKRETLKGVDDMEGVS